jgi:hypothetical protein
MSAMDSLDHHGQQLELWWLDILADNSRVHGHYGEENILIDLRNALPHLVIHNHLSKQSQ